MLSTNSPATVPRILFVATVDQFLRIVLTHMDACRAAGYQVDIACRLTQFEDEMRQHCDNLYEVPFARSPLHPTNIAAAKQLLEIMRENRYDLVHAHTPAGGMVGRFAATKAHVPIRMYTAHGFHFHPNGRWVSNTIFKLLEGHAGYHWSDLVQVVNTVDYQAALHQRIVPKEKLLLAPGTGVDVARFDPETISAAEIDALRQEYSLSPHGPVIGMIAELIPRKRPQDTLSVLKALKPDYPDAVLILLGAGPLLDKLKEEAKRMDISSSVRFLGFKRNTPAHLALMDLFIFTTQQEGFPVALMEAMSMGLAPVATDIRGNNDVVVDGETGLLTPVGNPEAMAEKCRTLLDDPVRRSRLGRAARKIACEKYRTEIVVGWQLEVYKTALRDAQVKGKVSPDLAIDQPSIGRRQ